MLVRVTCEHCDEAHAVHRELLGEAIWCRGCGRPLRPADTDAAPPALLPWLVLGGLGGLLVTALVVGIVVFGPRTTEPAPGPVAVAPKDRAAGGPGPKDKIGGPPVPPLQLPWVEPEDPRTPQVLSGTKFDEGHPLAFAPDSMQLAAPVANHAVGLFDLGSGQQGRTLQQHTKVIWSLAYSRDGGLLASASQDGLVKVWDVTRGEERAALRHGDHVRSVTFAPDGKTFASSCDDRTVRIWDAATCQEVRTLREFGWGVHCAAYAPTGNRLATTAGDFGVKLWDLGTGTLETTLQEPRRAPYELTGWGIAFAPDGTRVAVA